MDIASLWKNEQEKLSTKCLIFNTEEWQKQFQADYITSKYTLDNLNKESINFELAKEIDSLDYENINFVRNQCDLKYIAGLDISYIKDSENKACVAVVILSYPQLNVLYEDISMLNLSNVYIAGFLSYREAPGLIEGLTKVLNFRPDLKPQLIFIDGNGLLHQRKFGLACQIGLHFDTPCIGVAKHLYLVDGLENNINHKNKIKSLKKCGDSFPLIGSSETLYGFALRSTDKSYNPIYVSPGHKISTDLSMLLVSKCCKFRIPEPIRQADIRSRNYLRENGYIKIENFHNNNSKKKCKEKVLIDNKFDDYSKKKKVPTATLR